MKSKVTVDRAGRVVLPKALRDELQLSPGDSLDFTVRGNEVTMRPTRAARALEKEQGIWVFRLGSPLTETETRETLESIRAQRQRRILGEEK